MERATFDTPLGERSALIALPSEARAPAVIVIHEWWGVNADIQAIGERLASEGFVALIADLYGGVSTTDSAQAMRLSGELKTADALQELGGAVAFLKDHPRTTGKIGMTGFCLGGAITLAAAFRLEGLSAAVPFYGNPRAEFVDFSKKTPPIQGHYAVRDNFVDLERTRTIASEVETHGGSFELFVYEAGHAFMRKSDDAVYDEASSAQAWKRATDFLRKRLVG